MAYGLGNYAWYTQPSDATSVTGVLTLTVQPAPSRDASATVTEAAWEPARIGADGLPEAAHRPRGRRLRRQPGLAAELRRTRPGSLSPETLGAASRSGSRRRRPKGPAHDLLDLGRRGCGRRHEQHVVLLAALTVAQQRHHPDPVEPLEHVVVQPLARPRWARPRPRRRPRPRGPTSRGCPGAPPRGRPRRRSRRPSGRRRSAGRRRRGVRRGPRPPPPPRCAGCCPGSPSG